MKEDGRKGMHIPRWFASFLTGAALCAAGCSGAGTGPGDTRELADGHENEGSPGLFDPASFCPAPSLLAIRVPVLPQPLAVYRWGTQVPLSGTALADSGAGAEEQAELDEVAVAAGLVRGQDDIAVRVVLHDETDWSMLVTACGLDAGEIPGAYFLHAAVAAGTLEVHLFAAEATGRFYALGTLHQLLAEAAVGEGDVPGAPVSGTGTGTGLVTAREAVIFDRPAIGMRGLIEGFYGIPWAPEARLEMIALAGDLRMSHYLFAPKAEPLINTGWMLPFSPEFLAHLREMVEEGDRHHVRICVELHPSWMLHYSSDEDMGVLLGKFEAAIDQGVTCLALAFDDVSDKLIPPDDALYPDYTAAQADFVPKVGKALRESHPDLELVFVPVEYYTKHPRAATAWPAFAAVLPDYWEIAWTGQEIGNGAISLQDADQAAALMQRKPLLGDNYPVSDDANKTGVLFLGPLAGRSPDLLPGLSGIAFNAMPMPYSSLPALATTADYSWNPQGYDPAESMRNAALLLAGNDGAESLYTLSMANRSAMLEGSAAPELAAAVEVLQMALEAGEDPSGPATTLNETFFVPYSKVATDLSAGGLCPALAVELEPWAAKLSAYGNAGALALNLLLEKAGGGVPDPAQVLELEAQAAALESLLPKPTGDVMDSFLDDALARLGEL